jgi:hypothetical protein
VAAPFHLQRLVFGHNRFIGAAAVTGSDKSKGLQPESRNPL